MRRLALLSALLVGCLNKPAGTEDSGAPTPADCEALTWYIDQDGDQWGDLDGATRVDCSRPGTEWVLTPGDCDDTDATRSPKGEELCDGTDNDCDGDTDEPDATDAPTWYEDADGDGYGSDLELAVACDAPPLGVTLTGDCDDTSDAVHPAATEVCNSIDDDCDADIDDDDPTLDLGTATTFYADTDGDGYGDVGSTTTACTAPTGFVADATDCDDDESTVFPTNTEICNDGLDNDCDLSAVPCELAGDYLASDSDALVEAEGSGDELGQSLAVGLDVNGDGVEDLLVGAEAADPGGTSQAGAAYVLFGPLTGTLAAVDGHRLDGVTAGDRAGGDVVGTGDLDGDGYDDLAVSAEWSDYATTDAGAVYVVLGPLTAGATTLLSTGDRWDGLSNGDYTGDSIAGGLDLDNDGTQDILIGAYSAGSGPTYGGAVYFLRGPATAGGSLSGADAVWEGIDLLSSFGSSVAAAGDLDGDGVDDFIVGAGRDDATASDAGAAYVFRGPPATTPTTASAGQWTGVTADDHAGHSVAGVGDVDGDGTPDLLVGVYGLDDGGSAAGGAYLLLGPATAGGALSAADAKLVGEDAGDLAGLAVEPAGDVDGDGKQDVMLGAWARDEAGASAGMAYVVFGPISGTVDLSNADIRIGGDAASDWAGWSMAGGTDLDDDGFVDIVVGAPNGGSVGGGAYVFRGLGL